MKRQSPRTSPQLKSNMSRTFQVQATVVNSARDMSIDASKAQLNTQKSRMTQSLIDNQQSWAFKSKEPKVSIYRAEEKRIKMLYGSRQGLKYKIKLNDQILDPAQSDYSPKANGKISVGKTIEPNQLMQINLKKMNEKKEKDDIFGT